MKTRNIQLSEEMALRWKNSNDKELQELAKQTYPELFKKELPKSWEELGFISGFYTTGNKTKGNESDKVYSTENILNKNIFATEEQAKASIALAQLSQLKAVYNDGWVADWIDGKQKHCIFFSNNEIVKYCFYSSTTFLSFKDQETRDLFLENFKDLIMEAKSLLS